MDVIALHAAGFENAVATLGTAITSEQARIFAKYTKRVIICYDADNAGQTAASKAMRLFGEVGVEVRVLKLAGAKDPDEYIKKFGVDSFKRVIAESKTGFEFKLDKILSTYNIEIAEEKIKAAAEVSSIIANTYSGVERDIYIRRAAEILGVSKEAMAGDVERLRRKWANERRKEESKDALLQIKNIGDRTNPEAALNPRASAAEEGLLGLLLLFGEFRSELAGDAPIITSDSFVTSFCKRVFDAIIELEKSEYGYSDAMLGQYFTAEETGRIEKMKQDRNRLGKNDREVFLEFVENVKREKLQGSSSLNLADELAIRRAAAKKAKENKNT